MNITIAPCLQFCFIEKLFAIKFIKFKR